jgi:hypothetical protein
MSVKRGVLLLVGAAALLALPSPFTGPAVRAGQTGDLTPEAVAAVKALYPHADVVAVGREREQGVLYYEVAIRDGGQRIEIEVTADGAIGETETEVALSDLPRTVQDGISSLTRGAPVATVERHEIHGVARGETFAPLERAVVAYEVEFDDGGVRREVAVDESGKPLSLRDYEGPDDDSADDDSSEEDETP